MFFWTVVLWGVKIPIGLYQWGRVLKVEQHIKVGECYSPTFMCCSTLLVRSSGRGGSR